MKKFSLVPALILSTACYEYASFSPSPETLGKAMRIELNDVGTAHIVSFVGPGAGYIEGNLASLTDSTLTIAITDIGRRDGSEESWNGELVTLPKADAIDVSLRKASAARSTALTAFIVGGAALIARAISGGEGTVRTKPGGTSGGQ